MLRSLNPFDASMTWETLQKAAISRAMPLFSLLKKKIIPRLKKAVAGLKEEQGRAAMLSVQKDPSVLTETSSLAAAAFLSCAATPSPSFIRQAHCCCA